MAEVLTYEVVVAGLNIDRCVFKQVYVSSQ